MKFCHRFGSFTMFSTALTVLSGCGLWSIPHVQNVRKPDPAQAAVAGGSVGQWDRFEALIENTKRYDDPYRDVTLEAVYTRPDGVTVRFPGFHDGENVWRIRFMPDRLGTWKYKASFSDGSPGVRGRFECVSSKISGMISVDDSNPIWFGFKGGDHVLVRSFHVGDRFFASNWEPA